MSKTLVEDASRKGQEFSVGTILRKIPYAVSIKRYLWRKLIVRHDKTAFLYHLKPNSRILDVGCGNDSPFNVKTVLPMCVYTGLDIGDYNQSRPNLADSYIITTPEQFPAAIYRFNESFDAVISTHNIEHCNERDKTIDAMLNAVRPGGQIFMTFPCEQSVGFPSRCGTLNYYDDPTHKGLPPDFDQLIRTIESHGFEIQFSAKNYTPFGLWVEGFIKEKQSRLENCVFHPATWAYYGFESVIQARRCDPKPKLSQLK